jgi:hypothetical protein
MPPPLKFETLEKNPMLPDFQRNRKRKGFFTATGLLLLLAAQAFSQSGRRTAKPPSTPTPTPQTDTESPKPGARELRHKVSLLLGKKITSKHLLSEDAIFAAFVNSLGEFLNVGVTSVGDLKRDAAIKLAKSETEKAVVLLEFDVDEFQNGTIFLNSPDLDVKIFVFSPQTGQKKFEGKVYYKAVGGPMLKRDNWPNGTPIRITTEAVGIEAAEQVRDWLILEDMKKRNMEKQ